MKKIFISIILMHMCIILNAQIFQKIMYVSCDINSSFSGKKDSVLIKLYAEINNAGKIIIKTTDRDYNTVYYGYHLSLQQMNDIKSCFNIHKKLQSYWSGKYLSKQSFYGGSYDFFYVDYNNHTADSLCIVSPLMKDELKKIYEMLAYIFYTLPLKTYSTVTIPKSLDNTIIATYKKAKFLPPIRYINTDLSSF